MRAIASDERARGGRNLKPGMHQSNTVPPISDVVLEGRGVLLEGFAVESGSGVYADPPANAVKSPARLVFARDFGSLRGLGVARVSNIQPVNGPSGPGISG